MKAIISLALLFLATAATPQTPAHAFENTMGQRTMACTACHGKEGRAAPDGYYPRLAGKPAGYLYNQLMNFRDGRRKYGLMERMLEPLSDAYLMEISQHFASLEVPYPAPQPAAATPAVLERGKLLATKGDTQRSIPACVQCHGAALTGALPATPGLLGLPRDYLSSQLGAWKSGQRKAHSPDCMADIARTMPLEDVTAVTSWLAAQPVPANAHAAAALPAPPAIRCGSAPLPVTAMTPAAPVGPRP